MMRPMPAVSSPEDPIGAKSNLLVVKSKAKGYSSDGTLTMETALHQKQYALKGVFVPR